MNFSAPRHEPQRHLIGIAAVVLFHVAVVYALLTGLANKVVEVVRAPVQTRLIEEIKKPEPPPPPPPVVLKPLPTPRPQAPPPPAYVPPPEVPVAAPPSQQSITAVAPTPPPPAPAPAPAVEAPPPAPAAPSTVPVSASVVCSNYATVMGDAGYPREAKRAGLESGEALIQFTLSASGEIRDIKAVRASHPAFARAGVRIVADYKCRGQGHDVIVQVPFAYKTE